MITLPSRRLCPSGFAAGYDLCGVSAHCDPQRSTPHSAPPWLPCPGSEPETPRSPEAMWQLLLLLFLLLLLKRLLPTAARGPVDCHPAALLTAIQQLTTQLLALLLSRCCWSSCSWRCCRCCRCSPCCSRCRCSCGCKGANGCSWS